MMTSILHASTAITALSVALFAAPAHAQSQPQNDSSATPVAADAPQDSTQLGDIIVTAQRVSQDSQRTGIALDVVSTDELKNAGVVSSSMLNAAVPSLYVSKGGGTNTSYFIRGVGNFTNNNYSDPAVAFNVDGVYYGRPGSTVGTFYDLERLEVLKGPQGTLYGRNATGGAVNVISVKPKPGELSGYVSGSYGNFNAVDVEGAINLPLGPDGALRISGKYVDRDGYNDDGTFDEVGHGFRVQLLGRLTPKLTVLAVGDYAYNGGFGVGGSYEGAINVTPGTAATATSPANYTITPSGLDPYSGLLSLAGRAYFAGRVLGGPRINPGPLNTPYQRNDFIGAHLEIDWDTAIGKFTVIPAYRDAKVSTLYNGPSFRGGLIDDRADQFSIEARLAGKRIGPVDWLLGGFFFDETVKGRQTISQYTVQSFQNYNNRTRSFAGFGRLTLNLTDRLRLIGAARYTEDRKRFIGVGQNLIEICTNPNGCIGGPSVPVATTLAQLGTVITLPTAPGPANSVPYGTTGNRLFYVPVNINGELDRNRVTWRAAAEFDIAPRSLLYASYETGFRSGGFNFTLGRPTYEPEFIKAATIGIKNRFFDNKLQLNIEAFDWRYTNQQVAHFGLDATGGNSYFSENIGKSRIRGIDVDLQFKATRTTLFRGSVQYLDNKLTSFTYNTIRDTAANALPPAVGCATSPGTAPIPGTTTLANVWVVNCSGKSGFNSPKWSFNGGIQQTVSLDTNLELVANVDGRYRSNVVTSFEYLPFQNSGDIFIADASLRIGNPNGKWSVSAFVQNVTDKTYKTLSQFAGTTGNVIVTNYSPPRIYGVRATFGF